MNLVWILVATSLCAVAGCAKRSGGQKGARSQAIRYGGYGEPWSMARHQSQHQKQRLKRRLLIPTAILPEVLPRAMHWLKTGQGDLGFLAKYAEVASRKLKRRKLDHTPKSSKKQKEIGDEEKSGPDEVKLFKVGRRFLDDNGLVNNYDASKNQRRKNRSGSDNGYDLDFGFGPNYDYPPVHDYGNPLFAQRTLSGIGNYGVNTRPYRFYVEPTYIRNYGVNTRPYRFHVEPTYIYGPRYGVRPYKTNYIPNYIPVFRYPSKHILESRYGYSRFGQRFLGIDRFGRRGYGQPIYRMGPTLSYQPRYRPGYGYRPDNGFGSRYQYRQPQYSFIPSYPHGYPGNYNQGYYRNSRFVK